jgi:hypothetical protein
LRCINSASAECREKANAEIHHKGKNWISTGIIIAIWIIAAILIIRWLGSL